MIKINIISVGRFKDAYFEQAFLEYKKRLTPYCSLNLIETPERESPNGEERTKRDEAAFIFERVEKNKGYTIAFDRSGAELDSPAFAEFIHAAANDGSGVINLIIGGSRGLDPDLLQRADKILSFGKPTYPHRLFRVMLAEQLYRAFMIKNNREYHK